MKDNVILMFGKLVERRRRKRMFSQEELAYRGNIAARTLSDLERDMYYPNVAVLAGIVKKLDLEPEEFLAIIRGKGLLVDMQKGTNDDHDFRKLHLI